MAGNLRLLFAGLKISGSIHTRATPALAKLRLPTEVGQRTCQRSLSSSTLSSYTPSSIVSLVGTQRPSILNTALSNTQSFLKPPCHVQQQRVRTRVMFSYRTGGPKTVRAVVKRFMRLNNGMWIRPRMGRHRHMWKKHIRRKKRLQQHVFCNKTQCQKLDKMVNKYWRQPKYWADDPYKHYHKSTNLPIFRYKPARFYP